MTYLPLRLHYLTPEMVKKAKDELGETEDVQKEAIAKLRGLVRGDTNLIFPEDDDKYLIQFLRARKYNVKHAFTLLVNNLYFKQNNPEVFKYDFQGCKNSLASKSICAMPYRDNDGATIVIYKLDCWNYNERKLPSFIHDTAASIMVLLNSPPTQVCGIKIIVDLKSLSLNHIKQISIKYLLLTLHGIKNCLPARIKAIHVINESPIFEYFWRGLKFAFSKKIKERLHFHSSNFESLQEYISAELLPVEYGGKIDYDTTEILKHVDSLKHVYDEIMSYGYKTG